VQDGDGRVLCYSIFMKLRAVFAYNIEIAATVLIGLASICIAYTTHISGLWDGNSIEKYSKSNQMINEANTTYTESVVKAGDDTNDEKFDQLATAYTEQKNESDQLSEEADQANQIGDQYSLFSAILASVMFFVSLATIVKGKRLQQIIILIGTIIIALIIIKIGLLPRP
jgi:Flp pilus assembly protein TadB